jgi:hypothetical protein
MFSGRRRIDLCRTQAEIGVMKVAETRNQGSVGVDEAASCNPDSATLICIKPSCPVEAQSTQELRERIAEGVFVFDRSTTSRHHIDEMTRSEFRF